MSFLGSRVVLTRLTAAALALMSAPASAGAVHDGVMEKLSARLFPVLDTAARNPAMLDRIMTSPDVSAMLRVRRERRLACKQDLVCAAQASIWSPAESDAMVRVTARIPGLPVADDGAAAQIKREIAGINAVVRTYALGQLPPYLEIDGPGTVRPSDLQARLQAADWIATAPRAASAQRLDPSIDYALALLDVSDRTDAIGFEPLTGGLNAAAMARAKALDWRGYRYSAMIVTGVGPEIPGEALSPFGKDHVRLAASRFAQGDVAFIIVTGGRAHPRATQFAEAEQMRSALVERYGVPADSIVIEPYARHTTTNLRNASRLLMLMGAPAEADALIVCNPQQSAYIESARFTGRNAAELGYQPGRVGSRLSPTELVFRPAVSSRRVDPHDPLDP